MSDKIKRKYTGVCPIEGCKYTSKIPFSIFTHNNKNSSHSRTCPVHRTDLQYRAGTPKKKRKTDK